MTSFQRAFPSQHTSFYFIRNAVSETIGVCNKSFVAAAQNSLKIKSARVVHVKVFLAFCALCILWLNVCTFSPGYIRETL